MNREHAEQEVVRLADAWATAELRVLYPSLRVGKGESRKKRAKEG